MGTARKDQVTHNCAAENETVFVQHHGTGLAQHLSKSRPGVFKVIPDGGISQCKGIVDVLQIRQINLHPSFEALQVFRRFIAAAVPDHRHRQPALKGFQDRF